MTIKMCYPNLLLDRWFDYDGIEFAEAICRENLVRKPMSLRVQPLRITRQEAMKQLSEEGLKVRPSAFSSQGILIDQGNILYTDLYNQGLLTIQDQSSMLVSEMLNV